VAEAVHDVVEAAQHRRMSPSSSFFAPLPAK
jgi:hypothetical protein